MANENQELLQIIDKINNEKNEFESENKNLLELIKNNNVEKLNINTNFNNLTEIQLLSNMILLFTKYKNYELEEKNRLIIEKYLKETQKDFFQKMEVSTNELREKCYDYLENLKSKVFFLNSNKLLNFTKLQNIKFYK